MNETIDPRIQAFLRSRGKLAPVGVNCTLTRLVEDRIYVRANSGDETSGVNQDGEYFGRTKFFVNRNDSGRDIVTVPLTRAEETTEDTRLHWIPSLQIGYNWSITPGPPDILSFLLQLNILDVAVNPKVDYLRYDLWDETTTFTVDFDVNPGAFSWSASSLPDNSFQEDVTAFTQDVTVTTEETTVLVTLTANPPSGNVQLYRVLYTFQFAITGSDPISTVVQYQLPGTSFG